MRSYLAALAIVCLTTSTALAGELTSGAGVWVGVIGDTTYTLRLKTTSIDPARTIEEVDGTLTIRSMKPSGVTTRTVAASGQFMLVKDTVILNFGEPGRHREYGIGISWTGYFELKLFSIRDGRGLDFQGTAEFEHQPEASPTSPPR